MKSNKQHTRELCSRTIKAGHRVYFVDAKVDSRGGRFVAISELKSSREAGASRERHRIHIYEEDLPKFLDAMGDALTALLQERKAQSGEEDAYLCIQGEGAQTLGLTSATQVDIPALDDILSQEDERFD